MGLPHYDPATGFSLAWARPIHVGMQWQQPGWDIEVTEVLDTPPRFVWPLAGPFGALVLGVMVILSM